MDNGTVFKALADESRRRLLDLLFEKDGQTLTALERHLDMTRFGVMKHLRVLESAGLITTRRKGRDKHHFLNPEPIAAAYDRWVGKYAQPHLRVLAGLKSSLENPVTTLTKSHTHVIQTFIKASAEEVWQALTTPDFTEKYYFGTRVETSLTKGSPFRYLTHDGNVMLDGEVVECDPPRRLVTTFMPKWEEDGDSKLEPSQVTYELEESSGVTRLRLTHEGLPEGHPVVEGTFTGWTKILSGLKTLLETGSSMS